MPIPDGTILPAHVDVKFPISVLRLDVYKSDSKIILYDSSGTVVDNGSFVQEIATTTAEKETDTTTTEVIAEQYISTTTDTKINNIEVQENTNIEPTVNTISVMDDVQKEDIAFVAFGTPVQKAHQETIHDGIPKESVELHIPIIKKQIQPQVASVGSVDYKYRGSLRCFSDH